MLADQTLERAEEQEAAETHLMILESSRDELVNIAQMVHN